MYGIKKFFKLHLSVDLKTKQILALDVIDEHLNEGILLRKMVNHVTNSREQESTKKICSVLGDVSYNSNTNLRRLQQKKITSGIIRKELY